MDRYIQDITDRLLEKLPEEADHYQLATLASAGIPTFIIDRIRQELKRNLAESIILPDTDWANMESNAVQTAWLQFVQAIRDEARLPASFARSVMETAVADVLELLLLPRSAVVDYIFGADKSLHLEKLYERCATLMVYRHFAAVLPRYMERKELTTLDKERAQKVIVQVDEKLTARYSALNWTQMLEPLFDLFEGKVDPELLRRFFLDRDMSDVAEAFDRKEEVLQKADVIELLSDPEILLREEQEAMDRPTASGAPTASPSPSTDSPAETQPESSEDDRDQQSTPTPKQEVEADSDQPLESMNDDAQEAAHDDDEDEDVPIWKQFAGDESEEDEEEIDDEELPEDSLAAQFSAQADDGVNETDSSESKQQTPIEEETADQQADDSEHMQTNQQGEKIDEDGFIDEPIIDLTQPQPDQPVSGGEVDKQRLKDIHSHIEDNRDYFVDELFDGDEVAFDNALEEIAQFSSWRAASKYIDSEIFRRNLIDLYSEPAVDFTDRLHTYFLEEDEA
jgi:hypothetical protein